MEKSVSQKYRERKGKFYLMCLLEHWTQKKKKVSEHEQFSNLA